MISSSQIKAARALLRWSLEDLAVNSGVGSATVKRLETERPRVAPRLSTIEKLQLTLERAGVEFTGSAENKPGVCLDLEKHARYVEVVDRGQTQDD